MINSHEWVDRIISVLFAPEKRRVDRMIVMLNEENGKKKGIVPLGFMHMGNVYVPQDNMHLFKVLHGKQRGAGEKIPTLAFELAAKASEFMADLNVLKADEAKIRQVLYLMIHQANDFQELRDAIPDCIANVMSEFKEVPRKMVDCTYLIRNNWRSVRDYERALPKMEFYAMTALIY